MPLSSLLCTWAAALVLCAASALAQMNEGETAADAAVPENNAMAPVKDVPGLPRVLLIGDSISIAYTLPVRKLLEGKANVHRIPVNGSSSANPGRVKSWLGDEKWDVVHFNFGIHDAKIKGGKPACDLVEYEKNLSDVIGILQDSGAKIIFATTTPIPDVVKPDTRKFAPLPPYNEAALRIMKEENIPVDDLYAFMLPVQKKYQKPFDVHFTQEGSDYLAQAVAKSIEQQLPAAPAK